MEEDGTYSRFGRTEETAKKINKKAKNEQNCGEFKCITPEDLDNS
jgi:ketopantoate hydroxymethyltransferase